MTLKNTKNMVLLAIFIAIEILLAFTPLGFVPLGFTRATTIHIPIILGAILLGPIAGSFLGAVFGILSIIINTISPTITSFVFSPFYSAGNFHGSFYSILIALIPRMLIGVFAYYSFQFFTRITSSKTLPYLGAGIVGSLTNTCFVMGGIYLLFGNQYAAAKNIPYETLFATIMGIVGINGVPEAIVAAILVTALGRSLAPIFVKHQLI